jgi:acyl-coenzyme A thioesterase PaaI-like protein
VIAFTGAPNQDHLNPLGTVHGGWAATIMDSALACAVMTTLASLARATPRLSSSST